MVAPLSLWSFALAALLFGGLTLSELGRARVGVPRAAFLAALGLTGLWALTVAGIGPGDVMSTVAEALRNLAWLAFMLALLRSGEAWRGVGMVLGVYGIVALVVMGTAALAIFRAVGDAHVVAAADPVATVLGMMVAVSGLVLVHHLYNAIAPGARGGIRLVMLGLAALWAADLMFATLAYLQGGHIAGLAGARGVALVLVAPLFALAVHRDGEWTLKVSRTVAYQSLTLAAVLVYVAVMVLATSALAAVGGSHARLLQTAFILGATTAIITFVSSPWLRAWLKVKLAKHLFSHRYDYRAEWLRFTDTLGKPGDSAAPLEQRVAKAIADLVDAPAALLLVPEGAGLEPGTGWQWPGEAALPGGEQTAALAAYIARTGRIIDLDAVRDGTADAEERAVVPAALLDWADAWVLAPLLHIDQLTAAILLARPPVDRRPDWEDLDLLRLAGRHVASYLAEAHAHQALAEAQRFDEFNRRFAFILHDIKNLVSQLTLVARNAERHADNPEFRADMIATLHDSAARMNDLLARLSQHHGGRADAVVPLAVMPVAEDVARERRAQHPVVVRGDADALALADGARLTRLLRHLVQNAVEASDAAEPVVIAVSVAEGGIAIDVVDRGCGMSPGFVRDRLFKPFVSSKPNGFGLGAFEARQLAEAMGGTVSVASREGEGTRFRILLRAAPATPATTPHPLGRAA